MALAYEEALERGAAKLADHYYIVGEDLTRHEDYRRGFVMALAMVYGLAPQDVEQMIGEED